MFGKNVLTVASLLEAHLTGKLLTNQELSKEALDKAGKFYHHLAEYINHSTPNDETGSNAYNVLKVYTEHMQDIFEGTFNWE